MHHNFFEGVEQLDALMGGKKVKLPVFYRSARAFTAVFPASLPAVKKMIPDSRYSPAQLAPGIAAIHLTAFEYYDTDIEPYNEFAVGVLLNDPNFINAPSYNLLRQLARSNYYTYIHHLPVTTDLALRGGIDIYNYPKFLAGINFSDTEGEVTCDLSENGEQILTLKGKKISANKSGIMKFFCHLYQSKQLQSAEFKLNGVKYGLVPGFGKASLELGSTHPIAKELRGALLSTQPFLYIYKPDIQCILYGPDRISLPLLVKLMQDNLGIPLDELASKSFNASKSKSKNS